MVLAAHLLGDQISLLNWLGFALCLSGISLHVALKALRSRGDRSPFRKLCSEDSLPVILSPSDFPSTQPCQEVAGDQGPKPLKEQSSNPDLELLLWNSQPEEGDNEEEEESFVAQG